MARLRVREVPLTRKATALATFVALVFAILAGLLLLFVMGVEVQQASRLLFFGGFGSWRGLSETLTLAIPLLLAGLGVAIAFKVGFWNIGAEGQIYVGGFAAAWVALTLGAAVPRVLLIPLLVAAGFFAGALWGAIPVLLRNRWRVNEVIATLMLNYVAILWVEYQVHGPMNEGFGMPFSAILPRPAWLARLFGTRLHEGVYLAIAAAIVVYLILKYTPLGFKIRAVGANPRTARTVGISPERVMLMAMLIGGGLAGVAGMSEIAGVQRRLLSLFSPGFGFTAIGVALLGKLHPAGVVVSAVFFGGLLRGGRALQAGMGVPVAVVDIFLALVIFLLVGGALLARYRLTWDKRGE
ncbi:TPA: ABC transporter permease [Candidatus Acetothermia bacterium]|nr:ABC transporter permease [Candidatus Acetothermia bacterium]